GAPSWSTNVSPTARCSVCRLSPDVIVTGPCSAVGVMTGPGLTAGPTVALRTIAVTCLPTIGPFVATTEVGTMIAAVWAGAGVSLLVGADCGDGIDGVSVAATAATGGAPSDEAGAVGAAALGASALPQAANTNA